MLYFNSTLNFGIPPIFVFQLEVYYKAARLITGLTAQQKGTTARWYSNKTSRIGVLFTQKVATKSVSSILHCALLMFCAKIFSCFCRNSVSAKDSNPNHTSGNFKCADVYCINLDTYSKLDIPSTPVKVKKTHLIIVKLVLLSDFVDFHFG